MRKNANKIAPQIIILLLIPFTFLITSSHNKPVPSSRTPIIAKSRIFQSTSFVNCIAIKGTSKSITTAERMMISLLFFIVCISCSNVIKILLPVELADSEARSLSRLIETYSIAKPLFCTSILLRSTVTL